MAAWRLAGGRGQPANRSLPIGQRNCVRRLRRASRVSAVGTEKLSLARLAWPGCFLGAELGPVRQPGDPALISHNSVCKPPPYHERERNHFHNDFCVAHCSSSAQPQQINQNHLGKKPTDTGSQKQSESF